MSFLSVSNSSNIEQEFINETILMISKICKRNMRDSKTFDRQSVENDVRILNRFAKIFKNKSSKVLTHVCWVMANITENVEKCSIIAAQNGHLLILRVLKENISNGELCQFALATIGNLSRLQGSINMFDSQTCELIYDVIQLHSNDCEVIGCSFDVLCNLVHHDEKFRSLFGKLHLHLLRNFIKAAELHKAREWASMQAIHLFSILTTVNELVPKLQKVGLISLIINMMHIHATDIKLQNNCCGILAQMSSSNKFIHDMVEDQGIELLFTAMDLDAQNPWFSMETNVKLALFAASLDWDGFRMGSVHVAARNDLYESCIKCLSNGVDVNAVDDAGNTALHHSIECQHPRMVQLLVSRGADIHLKNIDQESALMVIQKKAIEEEKSVLLESVAEGKRLLKDAKKLMNELLFVESSRIVDDFPLDISFFIIEFLNPMTIMKYFSEENIVPIQKQVF